MPACGEVGKETLWGLLCSQQLSCEISVPGFSAEKAWEKRLQHWSLDTEFLSHVDVSPIAFCKPPFLKQEPRALPFHPSLQICLF